MPRSPIPRDTVREVGNVVKVRIGSKTDTSVVSRPTDDRVPFFSLAPCSLLYLLVRLFIKPLGARSSLYSSWSPSPSWSLRPGRTVSFNVTTGLSFAL